jgi:hypothetical protein
MIFTIDPGTTESAYVIMDDNYKPIQFEKIENNQLLDIVKKYRFMTDDYFVIEMVANYGMRVGDTVFETVFWIGRFWEACSASNKFKIKRKDVKMNLCNMTKVKDSHIRQSLIQRFAVWDTVNGKGNKNNPDWFFGFKADVWQAYALAVTFKDKFLTDKQYKNNNCKHANAKPEHPYGDLWCPDCKKCV